MNDTALVYGHVANGETGETIIQTLYTHTLMKLHALVMKCG